MPLKIEKDNPQFPETRFVDAKGARCPLPVLKIRKAAKDMRAGEKLRALSDDPKAEIDIPSFCEENGFALIEKRRERDACLFLIEKIA